MGQNWNESLGIFEKIENHFWYLNLTKWKSSRVSVWMRVRKCIKFYFSFFFWLVFHPSQFLKKRWRRNFFSQFGKEFEDHRAFHDEAEEEKIKRKKISIIEGSNWEWRVIKARNRCRNFLLMKFQESADQRSCQIKKKPIIGKSIFPLCSGR